MKISKFMEKKIYIVQNKADDYGNCRTELVETTPELAKEYYYSNEVKTEDIETLKKYFDIVDFEEESHRDDNDRFYGNE